MCFNYFLAQDRIKGGFGGGPQQLPHCAPMYASVLSLLIIGTPEAYAAIDRYDEMNENTPTICVLQALPRWRVYFVYLYFITIQISRKYPSPTNKVPHGVQHPCSHLFLLPLVFDISWAVQKGKNTIGGIVSIWVRLKCVPRNRAISDGKNVRIRSDL